MSPSSGPFHGATGHGITRRGGDRAFGFTLAALLTLAGWIGVHRNGSWDQLPHYDAAGFYEYARDFAAGVKSDGFAGFFRVWVHGSGTHTPFVPAVSSGLMLVFGESFRVALAAIPLFGFVFCVSLVGVLRRLYPASTSTVYASAALTVFFPVVLNQSRLYLFEFPMAALALTAFWAMLASEGFTRLVPTLTAGAMAGLTGLARGGAPATLAGACVVAACAALASPPRGVKLRNMAAACAVAAALWSTWYVPNLTTFLRYLSSVTYGAEASVFAAGESSLTWESAVHYFVHNVSEGAGLPLLALAFVAWIVNCNVARRILTSRTMLALGAVYALTFLTLMTAAQRCGAILFLPVIGIQGVAIARAVAGIAWKPMRVAAGIAAALLATHHAWGLTFGVNPAAGRQNAWGPFGKEHPVWDHNDTFLAVTQQFKPEVEYALGMSEALRQALEVPGVPGGAILLLAHHPFVNASNLRGLPPRLPRDVRLTTLPLLTEERVQSGRELTLRDILAARAVIVRTSSPKAMLPEERRYSELFEPLTTGDSRIFDPAGEPIRFGDDSQLRVYGRRGALTAAVTRALEQLGAESLPAAARVAVLSRHPFVKCVTNEIGGCALRRRFRLDVPDDFAHGDDRGSVLTEWAMRFLTCENFVVVRVGPSETVPPVEQEWMACLTPLARGSVPIFQTPHPPIPLPDGSSLVVLTRNEGLVQEVADVAKRIADSRHENGSVFVAAVGETAVVELVRQACHEVCLPRQWALHAFPSIADFRDGTAARSVSDHRNLRADWKRANFLVVCQDPGAVDSVSRLSRDLVGPMIDGPTRAFELDRGSSPIGTATVPSAAVAALFRPLPAVEWVDGAPSGWKAADASFEPPAGEESPVKLVAYEVYAADRWLRVDLALSTTTGQGRLPVMVLHFRDAAGVDVESIVLEPLGRGRPAGTDSREAFVVTRGFVACHGLDWRRPGPYSVDVKATSPGTWKDWTGRASLRLPDLGDAK